MRLIQQPLADSLRACLRTLAGTPLLVLALVACEDRATTEWSPADHKNNEQRGQVSGSAAPGQEDATLVAVTWRQNCAVCHGVSGRGDGPQARMMKVPDLARSELQEDYSDEQIAAVIKSGRNQMPSFASLPPKVVEGLVQYIRALGSPKGAR